ncbi:hypothetical protein HDV00_000926 [Rhizophlyctis rosea]|nr:hypothetical protein HDV00_000926 [Rhizophlyctis rosea]
MTSIPVLLCCFCSGLVDASVFNAYGVFATMQTGNTIILALGASHQPTGHPHSWLQALLAISFFFLGALFHARTTRPLTPLKHTTLALSFTLQTTLLIIVAALVQSDTIPRIAGSPEDLPYITLTPLPLLAFQAGMQSVVARQLGINEVPTTVLTSIFCDLGNDPKLFVGITENWTRNRRVGAVACILVGGIIGGWLSKTPNGMPTGIWFAAAIKAAIVIAWLAWPSARPQEDAKV